MSNCKNCGAPLDRNNKCNYCDTLSDFLNECWSCLGTGDGYYEHSKCPVCNGKGYLLQEDYYEV